jgi:hypothetical protein
VFFCILILFICIVGTSVSEMFLKIHAEEMCEMCAKRDAINEAFKGLP